MNNVTTPLQNAELNYYEREFELTHVTLRKLGLKLKQLIDKQTKFVINRI